MALLQEAELGRAKGKPQGKESFKTKFVETAKPKQQLVASESEDKLAALKSFKRRLSFKCGNKWTKDHKCPPQVALHVIEELLDALEDEGLEDIEQDSEALEETVMAVGALFFTWAVQEKDNEIMRQYW